ncbi:MAG: ParB/RepB/Spo0J family partition protein [Candidatus Kapaibacterium sp.]
MAKKSSPPPNVSARKQKAPDRLTNPPDRLTIPADRLAGRTLITVDIDLVEAKDGFNPRDIFEEQAEIELSENIKDNGLIHPPTARPRYDADGNIVGYDIITGERRVRACRRIGWTEIPVIVLAGMEDGQHAELALIENLFREDLNSMEVARGYQKLHLDHGRTVTPDGRITVAHRDSMAARKLRGVQLAIRRSVWRGRSWSGRRKQSAEASTLMFSSRPTGESRSRWKTKAERGTPPARNMAFAQ